MNFCSNEYFECIDAEKRFFLQKLFKKGANNGSGLQCVIWRT